MGNTAGKLSEKATRNPLESRRGPPGRRRKTSEIAAGKTPFRVTPHPCGGKACAHISICQRTSLSISIHPHPITHRQSTPVTPLVGLGCVNPAPTALAAGTAAPMLVGWGCVCMEPKRPVPKTPQAASPCSWACRRLPAPPPHSKRKEAPKPPTLGAWVRQPSANDTGSRPCRPLLVGLPPFTRTAAPFGTKRSAQAPYSWGLGASTPRQRHWPPALPPPCS